MNNPHELIHDNITLLSFIVPFNPGLENVFRKGMFAVPNKMGFNEVVYHLLNIIYPAKCKETLVWPCLSRKDEMKFRSDVAKFIAFINEDQETDFNDKFNLDKNKSNNVQDPKEKHTVYPHNPVDLPSCSYQTSARHRASEVKLETNQPYKVHSSCKLKVNDTAKTVLGESGSKKNILLPATTKSHNSPITAKPQTNQTRETQFIFHDPKKSAFSQVCDTFVTICCMIVDGIVLMKLICGDDIINKDTLWDVVDILHPKDNSCSFNIIEPEID